MIFNRYANNPALEIALELGLKATRVCVCVLDRSRSRQSYCYPIDFLLLDAHISMFVCLYLMANFNHTFFHLFLGRNSIIFVFAHTMESLESSFDWNCYCPDNQPKSSSDVWIGGNGTNYNCFITKNDEKKKKTIFELNDIQRLSNWRTWFYVFNLWIFLFAQLHA